MVNFLQHKHEVIENFCNTFKKDAYKKIWGISVNCNVKGPEEVWLDRELLIYQTQSEDRCASGCTIQNPVFVITQYAGCNGSFIFPDLFPFNAGAISLNCKEDNNICGKCCTNIVVNNGQTIKTYNLIVANQASSSQPVAGNSVFIFPALIGYTIQFAFDGYGFYTPGVKYNFDILTGTLTLLGGLLFNFGETYTIIAYK